MDILRFLIYGFQTITTCKIKSGLKMKNHNFRTIEAENGRTPTLRI